MAIILYFLNWDVKYPSFKEERVKQVILNLTTNKSYAFQFYVIKNLRFYLNNI